MKIKWCLTLLLAAAVALPLSAASSDDIIGEWFTDSGESKVEIVKDGKTFSGKIVWLEAEVYPEDDEEAGVTKYDRNNPDEKLKPRPILGLPMLSGFKFDKKDDRWEGGKIYDPESGKTYYCKMWLDDEGNLNVRGSIDKWGLAGRSTVWTPAE